MVRKTERDLETQHDLLPCRDQVGGYLRTDDVQGQVGLGQDIRSELVPVQTAASMT